MTKVAVWDLPLRLFHWLLAAAVLGLVVTAKLGGNFMECHGKLGLLVLGLVVFRLVWGFVGSTHARFANFLPTPARLQAYLRGEWHGLGHNPLGALSVCALLALLLFQPLSGLVANDDIAFQGPLYALVTAEVSERLSAWHHEGGEFLVMLAGLHVAAIAFYLHIKKDNLLRPMLSGEKDVLAAQAVNAPSQRGGGIVALVLALTVALAVVYLVQSGLLLHWFAPPPVAAAPAPAW